MEVFLSSLTLGNSYVDGGVSVIFNFTLGNSNMDGGVSVIFNFR